MNRRPWIDNHPTKVNRFDRCGYLYRRRDLPQLSKGREITLNQRNSEMLQMAFARPWIADTTVNHFQGRR
ncbi:hypothetical protein T01_12124 [Trichinella spiralis]|uniref:Uncharacterized protein n=1 Tax=Trichinella spiralis TaxID=6334 RepID=A0A0V1AHI3_TRISP|nr:hypothetical protein T01_12124 [Trichinella spiralis]